MTRSEKRRRQLMVTTALSICGLMAVATSAEANCTLTTAPNIYTCANATTNFQVLIANPNAQISTLPGYGVALTGNVGYNIGLHIFGDGAKTYTDSNATTIDTRGASSVGSGTVGGLYIVLGRDLPGSLASALVRSNGSFYTSGAGVTFGGQGGTPESGTIDAIFTGDIVAGRTGLSFFTPGQGATVTVNNVKGNNDAIQMNTGSSSLTEARVLGDATINTNGLIRGEANRANNTYGINVGVTTTPSAAAGTAPGVKTNINVASSSIVEGATAAIRGVSFIFPGRTGETDLNPIVVNNNGIVRNNSQLSDALAITGSNVRFVINNNNLIQGTVVLGKYGDAFNNAGTWNTANGSNDFGAGNDTVENSGIVVAAANAGLAETTSFLSLETFSNNAAGVLTMNDGATGDQTVVGGNFVSNGGALRSDTFLGSDGAPSDLLVINGNARLAAAPTRLYISNTGGPGSTTVSDGIKVVQVDGTSDASAFALGSNVTAGAFEYNLFLGGVSDVNDQDWYLRSIGLNGPAQEEGPYAQILSNFANSTLGTLQQRMGNRIWPGDPQSPDTVWCKEPEKNFACTVTADQGEVYEKGDAVSSASGAWGRAVGEYSTFEPEAGSAYTQKLGFFQGGYEAEVFESEAGLTTFGIFGTYGTSRADIDLTNDPLTGASRSGEIASTGYGIGANLTWLGNDGAYVDGIGQYTWYDSDLSSAGVKGDDGSSYALSLEAGQRFDLSNGMSLVPQAQITYTSVDFDDFTDALGSAVSLGEGESLTGRIGIRLEKLSSWKDDNGETQRLQAYGIVNLTNEFLGATSIEVAGTSVRQEERSLRGEIGLGGTYSWNDKGSVYGEASYSTALGSGFGDSNTGKGVVGLRYKW